MADLVVEKGNDYLVKRIRIAKERIFLVSYMLTSLNVIEALHERAKAGCKVSVLTLPSDMISGKDRTAVWQRVRSYHEELAAYGSLKYADLEIGEPAMSQSSQSDIREGESIGRKWYALHAKFLVVDDVVIMTTANCGHEIKGSNGDRKVEDDCLWQIHWSKQDSDLALEYIQNYEILSNALQHDSGQSIFRQVEADSRWSSLVKRGVSSYRLTDYPTELLGKRSFANRRKSEMIIFPLMATARHYLTDLIRSAKRQISICVANITDDDILELILRIVLHNPAIKVRLLSGPTQGIRDANLKAKLNTRFLPVLTSLPNVEWRELEELHAKLWITEEAAAIGSVNANKMSLGFNNRKTTWRSSVEALQVCSMEQEIDEIASAFEVLWSKGVPVSAFAEIDWLAKAVSGSNVPKVLLSQIRKEISILRQEYWIAVARSIIEKMHDSRS